jgi:oligopeptide/dipeptide ABC transporter ATP-binding protein
MSRPLLTQAPASPAPGGTLIDVREIKCAIGTSVEIGPVTLAMKPGESFGIVGETGSGKSVLCRTIAGLIGYAGGRISGGEVAFDGELLSRDAIWPRRLRHRGIGFVPQASQSGLNPVRRVRAHLDEALREMGVASKAQRKADALDLLARVRLPDPEKAYESYRHELSGGMQQRVMIALALATQPRLLIADEPTTALDATVQSEILDLIADLQRELDMALIIVSHDLAVIRRLCVRTGIMYAGRLVEVGVTERLLHTPLHPYTDGLINCDPAAVPVGEPLKVVPGTASSPSEWRIDACSFASRCALATDECRAQRPPLDNAAPGHQVACIRWQEIEKGATS